jgi:hypothetical protein
MNAKSENEDKIRKTILGYIEGAKEENNEKRHKTISSQGKEKKNYRGVL